MLNIFKKLAARTSEIQRQVADEWPQLVADIVDEKLTDADEILAELDRLNRTPEDLQTAVELLSQRREWARLVAVGDVAEREYRDLKVRATDAQQKLEKLIEAHRTEFAPLDDAIHAAHQAMSARASAARQLTESAGESARQQAFDEIDRDLAGLQAERRPLLESIRGREDWLRKVLILGSSAATADVDRLPAARSELAEMQQTDSELRGKIDALQARRNEAESVLMNPEAI